MTVIRVNVTDLGLLAGNLRKLAEDWEEVAEDAMKGALVDGGYLREVMIRIPKSEYARYASRLTGEVNGERRRVGLTVTKAGSADGTGWGYKLPSSWAKRWGVDPKRAAKVRERYGHGRLQKSIVPDGNSNQSFWVTRNGGKLAIALSSSLPYAARMHEARKPAEGDYWRPGRDDGWSTPRTGNKYLERPYIELQDKILRQFGRNVDRILRDRGLMRCRTPSPAI